ncbi:MAG: hypothetical protein UW60_C0050G0007 [Candidatus Woesebacteria bacterium GW2011_GWA2_44_33]|uniref:PIN domain-containing protein n=1 Tax=Candidatus Woesebacteria bacterium GW2011_GWA2_44_33 TaxID=1618564 RepID=A0A0G1LYT7_9BACT|nr:MAG: hypothetical protein UW60_C0050G0007 [Candidatus Woesebacteria bacterium GW2011_GWA2_44_33]
MLRLAKQGKITGVISEIILDEVLRHAAKFNLTGKHILASCEQEKTGYLVTLDKKHLLVLRGKTKGLKIVTPGELIIMVKK